MANLSAQPSKTNWNTMQERLRETSPMYVAPPSKAGKLHCPKPLAPQTMAVPSLLSRTVCFMPAATCVYVASLSKAGKLHCP